MGGRCARIIAYVIQTRTAVVSVQYCSQPVCCASYWCWKATHKTMEDSADSTLLSCGMNTSHESMHNEVGATMPYPPMWTCRHYHLPWLYMVRC